MSSRRPTTAALLWRSPARVISGIERLRKMSFDRSVFAQTLRELAAKNVFLGTSSWKYAGWCDLLYERAKYEYRGKFAESRFDRNCLREYAEVFKSVCVDAAFYKFPDRGFLDGLISQVPADFRFSFKVTDAI